VLDMFGLTKTAQNKAELVDLLSGRLVMTALSECGVQVSLPTDRPLMAGEVVRHECYGDPALLRDVDMATPAADLDLPDQYFFVDGKPPGGIAASRADGAAFASAAAFDDDDAAAAAAAAPNDDVQPVQPAQQPMQPVFMM